jgi:hypothetical protein
MSEYLFSAFPNILEVSNPKTIDVETAYRMVTSNRYQSAVEEIRAEDDKKKRNELKKNLASITFSGIFSRRRADALVQHSGLLCIDFDDLGDQLHTTKEKLRTDPHTMLLFTSPSGNGLKLVIKIPGNIETHAFSCRATLDYYDIDGLDNFEDVCRVCFISHDTDAYYNPESEIFKDIKYPQPQQIYTTSYEENSQRVFENLEKWMLKKGIYYTDGTKHNYLIRFAAALCRFGIPESESLQMMIAQYQNACEFVDTKDFERIVKQAYQKFSHQYGSQFFEKTTKQPKSRATSEEVEVMDDEVKSLEVRPKDVIFLNDVRESMVARRETGAAIGETTYFPELDKHWKWRRGEINLLHGIGNYGKTTLLMFLCLVKSFFEGTKWAIFSPENMPPDDFYDELVQMIVGKPTQKLFSTCMTDKEYSNGMDFVQAHFFSVYPKSNSHTPEYLNESFGECIVKLGVAGCVKDPFNQMTNDWAKHGGRDDQYIEQFLSKEKAFATVGNIYDFVVAHPKGSVKKTEAGDFERPDVYDIAGGGMWNNKMDNILCVHRPFRKSIPTSPIVEFESQKIKKQKLTGEPGLIQLTYNVLESRYYIDGKCPLPKPEGVSPKSVPAQPEIKRLPPQESEKLPF